MPLNSVNTNTGAMIALQSLNRTADELTATQKRISTGYRVSDAKDDGAAYAVAERVRGEIAATQSANEQLGGVKGLLDVTNASLNNVSDTLKTLKTIVVKLADGTITSDQKAQYQSQVKELTSNIKSFIQDANYNGQNILTPSNATLTRTVVRNGAGDNYTFSAYAALTNIYNNIAGANSWSAESAAAAVTNGGALTQAISNTLTQLNNFGSYSNYIDSQITYNKAKMDAQESGLGALVDADLAKESAKLQSLQIRQQLGTQALSIANSAPQSLLSLFR
ncbi:flagellin [Roseicella frigidaeris]|uniref:Flagellin n=1 Tax=Roseicella frigidaeris TaxID=2230885 RepID=A0A327M216_9PROT|nr:flagellin [Roseicella frigidaeris]RAI56212.1 flagellin [Roseicella frigidaeris]